MNDLVLILRYRKAVTYGFHVLLGALETHETATTYEVRFAIPGLLVAVAPFQRPRDLSRLHLLVRVLAPTTT